jgi:hypothetical protein
VEIDQAYVDNLVMRPSETREVEIKAWIDLGTPDGKAKVLTAALALRNFNGGYLVIGFDNNTLQPLLGGPEYVAVSYHNDELQALVSKHASETFDVVVCFGQRDGRSYPVICIDSGVRTPVAVKVPITDAKNKQIIAKGTVFFGVFDRTVQLAQRKSSRRIGLRSCKSAWIIERPISAALCGVTWQEASW